MATIEERLKDAPRRLIILAACAFARSVEHLLKDQPSRDAIDVAELFADGVVSPEETEAAAEAAKQAATSAADRVAAYAATAATWDSADWAQEWIAEEVAEVAVAAEAVRAAETATSQSILDCILPHRLQLPFPAHVKGLATIIYEKRDWSLMPILADALEEMGLDGFAQHCRHPIHARGCHVLDSILGLHCHQQPG